MACELKLEELKQSEQRTASEIDTALEKMLGDVSKIENGLLPRHNDISMSMVAGEPPDSFVMPGEVTSIKS